jgi:hypothetical protein
MGGPPMTALTVAADKAALDSGEYDVAPVHEALCFAIVCQRVGIEPQRAIDRALFPAGTSLGWQYVERGDLPEEWWAGDGAALASPTLDPHDAPYPQPCHDHPSTHVHVLAAC